MRILVFNFLLIITFTSLFAYNAPDSIFDRLPVEKQIDSLISLGIKYKVADPQKSIRYLQQSVDLLKHHPNAKDEAEALKIMGLSFYRHSQYLEALDYYDQALMISRKIGDSIQVANVLHNMGLVYRETNQWDKALALAFQVLKLDKYAKNERGLGYSYNNLGLIYQELEDTLNAKINFEKSLAIRSRIDHQEGIGYTCINLGNIAIDEKDYAKGKEYFTRAAAIFKKLDDPYTYCRALYSLGNIAWYENNKAKAKRYYEEVLKIRIAKNAPIKDMAESYTVLGLFTAEEKRYQKADSLYKIALDYALRADDLNRMSELYNLLHVNSIRIKEYKLAIEYLDKHFTLREKIFDKEKLEKFALLESNYELEKRKAELDEMKKEKQLREKNAHLNQMMTTALILLLLIIIISSFIIIKLKSSNFKLLDEKNQELIRINQSLDQFVSIASHDLKAPIASAKGIIGIIREQNEMDCIREFLNLQEQSLNRLELLIKDLLDFSRSSRLAIKINKVDLREKIDSIKNNLQFEKAARNVSISYKENASSPLFSDELRLQIILNNLISNSIRYKNTLNTKPFVKIESHISGEKALIIVSDNGVGIAKAHHAKIFDMFYKASTSAKSTGLGLYIVKESINKLKGKIWFETEQGLGTTFYLEVPNLVNYYQEENKAEDEVEII